jgi:hypothetical protein
MQRGFAFSKHLSFLDTAFQVQKNVVSFLVRRAIQIVRLLESMAEIAPTPTGFA